MHCQRFVDPPVTRREMLGRCAAGFGGVALAALLNEDTVRAGAPAPSHFAPQAKRAIFVYMDGGVSQIDSFDPKPRLAREHGKPYSEKIEPTQFDNVGTVFASPWEFAQHGECGAWVSDLFPHVAQHVDKLAIVRSMVSEFSEHNTANFFLHTGFGQAGPRGTESFGNLDRRLAQLQTNHEKLVASYAQHMTHINHLVASANQGLQETQADLISEAAIRSVKG